MKHKRLVNTVLMLVLYFMGSRVTWAEEEDKRHYVQPLQELFMSETVYPQDRGEMQIAFGANFSNGEKESIVETPISMQYGLSDFWELQLEWNGYAHRESHEGKTTQGVGDLSIGSKYSFMNIANSNFHTALGFEMSFPIGSVNKGISDGLMHFEPFIVMAYDLPKLNHSQLFTQVILDFVHRLKGNEDSDKNEPAAHESRVTSGFFIPFNRLVYTTEFTWQTNEWNNGGNDSEMYITPGLVVNLPGAWEAGVGVPIGLTEDSDNFRVIGRVNFEFNVLGKPSRRNFPSQRGITFSSLNT
jgi:outer membrane putative beta-barrel porin/alpha-amylase